MIDQGHSVLNRGLGALKPRFIEKTDHVSWFSQGGLTLIFGALITFPATVSIEVATFLALDEPFFNPDPHAYMEALMRLASIPLVCAGIHYLVQHIRRTLFWWDPRRERGVPIWCDPFSRGPMLLAMLGLVRSACLKAVNEPAAGHIGFYLKAGLGLICLHLYYALLDRINAMIKGMAQEQEAINSTAPVSKMQSLVRNVTRSGRKDRDAVYCFPQTNTVPAEVLSYSWWLYYAIGKVSGVALIIALLMGADDGLVYHAVIGGIAFSAVTASGFMFELGPSTLSLFRLSLNKPFYVGDLVTLNMNGAMDSPDSSVMGFVENITMMYVVIRNFEMKQTWIPHRSFNRMIIQNWTRRPSKTVLLNMGVSCRCPAQKVEQLTRFGKRWIQASEEIQQTNYQKCHITRTGNGYNIQVIFFPAIGVTHRGIRQKFLLAFMSAAERMQIPFVPLQIMQNFAEPSAAPPVDASAPLVTAEMCADLLPDPNDRLPKGVGLGFREFPKASSGVDLDPSTNRDIEAQEDRAAREVMGDAMFNQAMPNFVRQTSLDSFFRASAPNFERQSSLDALFRPSGPIAAL